MVMRAKCYTLEQWNFSEAEQGFQSMLIADSGSRAQLLLTNY